MKLALFHDNMLMHIELIIVVSSLKEKAELMKPKLPLSFKMK
jgi:hypothetical protein